MGEPCHCYGDASPLDAHDGHDIDVDFHSCRWGGCRDNEDHLLPVRIRRWDAVNGSRDHGYHYHVDLGCRSGCQIPHVCATNGSHDPERHRCGVHGDRLYSETRHGGGKSSH